MKCIVWWKKWENKLSLKDRLNTANKTNNPLKKEIESEAPKYYETNEQASKSNTLGVLDMIFADDDVNNIFVNGAKNIYIEKQSKSSETFRDQRLSKVWRSCKVSATTNLRGALTKKQQHHSF